MISNSPEVPEQENYTDKPWWSDDLEVDSTDMCEHCNGTGLSDFWDEESYCEMCYGMGYLT